MKKKYVLISSLGIFILCFLTHFIYEMFPNNFFSIFFPVNESIWEHMKMLFTTILLYGLIDKFIIIKTNRKINNYLFALLLSAIISIPIYLIIFLPIYYKIGANMIIIFIILFIAVVLSSIVKEMLFKLDKKNYLFIISLILITIIYIGFGYLTYKPFKNHLFFDTESEKYGINIYNI